MARHSPVRDERGDTLVEILIALVILSVAVIALIGSLLTSTSVSTTHRGVANLDSILRSMAESARYQIQTQPQDGTVGPLFRPCSGSPCPNYPLVSDPYPAAAPAGTPIVLFATGFNAAPLAVTVNGAGVSYLNGNPTGPNATIVFNAPTTGGAIRVTDGTNTTSTRTPLSIGASSVTTNGQAFASYSLTSAVNCVDPLPCAQAQQITLTMANTQPASGASDQINFVVGNLAPQPIVVTQNITPSSPGTLLPATLVFTAHVTLPNGSPPVDNTSSVFWKVTGPNTSCQAGQTVKVAGGQATCQLNLAVGQQGTYTATATYCNPSTTCPSGTGGPYPSGQSGQASAVVSAATPSVAVSADASTGPLIFTATVSGSGSNWPGQNLNSTATSWTIAGSDGSNPPCDSLAGPSGSGTTATWTCTLNTPAAPLVWTAYVGYAGDPPNYSANQNGVTVLLPAVTVNGTSLAGVITLKGSVAGPPGSSSPTGTITWSISPAPPAGSGTCTSSAYNGGQVSCSFLGVVGTNYTAKATYAPDAAGQSNLYIGALGTGSVTG